MSKTRKEIAESWNAFVKRNIPFELKYGLYEGDEDAIRADLETYLGDGNIMTRQSYAGDRIGTLERFTFPEKREKVGAVRDCIRTAHDIRLAPDRMHIQTEFQNELAIAHGVILPRPEKSKTLFLDRAYDLDEIKYICFDLEKVEYLIKGDEYPICLDYEDCACQPVENPDLLVERLAESFVGFLESDELSFGVEDVVEDWVREAEEPVQPVS